MATKRVFDDSNNKDQDNPNDKRMRPSFASYALSSLSTFYACFYSSHSYAWYIEFFFTVY